MKRKQAIEKLRDIVSQDLSALEKNIIVPEKNGYLVFGCYRVTDRQGIMEVCKNGINRGRFSSLRTAISWCVADKYNQHRLTNDIERLEQQKIMLKSDLDVRANLARKFKTKQLREAADAKINARQHRLKFVDFQLTKCVNLAKYWQIRGFNNETARTGRTPSNRTNR